MDGRASGALPTDAEIGEPRYRLAFSEMLGHHDRVGLGLVKDARSDCGIDGCSSTVPQRHRHPTVPLERAVVVEDGGALVGQHVFDQAVSAFAVLAPVQYGATGCSWFVASWGRVALW